MKKTGLYFNLVVVLFTLSTCTTREDTLFTELDKSTTGIGFQNTLFEDGPLNVSNYIYFYNGGGVAVGDINNDGLPDILFTGNMVRNRLYLNKGNFQFEDITPKSTVDSKQGWCTGATFVDINEDGYLDIYICRSADGRPEMRKNLLFINNKDLTFTEKAEEYGLAEPGYSTQAGFFDYDLDGDLDCFIINHSSQKNSGGLQDNLPKRKEFDPAFACKLYRNDNKKFIEVGQQSGILSNVLTFGLGLAFSDVNQDGWPDIYVSNDFNEPDYLFINQQNGTFRESLASCMDEISLFSMGSDVADYNNDGLTDIVTLDMMPEDNYKIKTHSGAENFDKFQYLFRNGFYYQYSRNMMQRNNGDGTFSEVGQLAGISNTDWSWSALLSDFDNDGFKDLFISNGYVKDYTEMDFLKYSMDRIIRSMHKDSVDPVPVYISKMPTIQIPNYVFRNNGDGSFEKKSEAWGLKKAGVSAGAAYADFDQDGDLDLVVNNTNDLASIYRNNQKIDSGSQFLRVKLTGTASNTFAIGSKVQVYAGGQQFTQEVFPVRGFQSSSDMTLNFGLGRALKADSVIVTWPGGYTDVKREIPVGTTLTLKNTHPSVPKPVMPSNEEKPLLTIDSMEGIRHQENSFNDFSVQSLLPHYLSREGPGIAVADLNGDDLDDFFTGGASGFSSRIFMQQKDGKFNGRELSKASQSLRAEDVTALFFDADGDGDQDLYAGAGGYEFSEQDAYLQDRLYINDGKGNLSWAGNALPKMLTSTACVSAGDLDGDGDLDLFVGSRVIPGKYPLAPQSYLLINDGKGVFTDQTEALAPLLKSPGMVTAAQWADVNADKHLDLIVAGEWMPAMVLMNSKGKLSLNEASMAGFAHTGWWKSVVTADVDGDGDLDVFLGNVGANTQYKVSASKPILLHYNDFDRNGNMDIVISYFVGDTAYPANSLDDLAEQMPFLKKKFLEYKTYAAATIDDLFTPEQMLGVRQLSADTMASLLLINDGKGIFKPAALPSEVQYAPIYNAVWDDFTGDGKPDFLMTGNQQWIRIKYGRYSANHGLLLAGNGQGKFNYIPQWKSGLKLRGQVRGTSVIRTARGSAVLAAGNDGAAYVIRKFGSAAVR